MAAKDLQPVFDRLKKILESKESKLIRTLDTPGNYSLNAPKSPIPKQKELYFGGVHIKKNYVSYYLMPVYMYPELLKGISPSLKKRMQGKSCFNFAEVDEKLFTELARLTKASLARLRREKLL